MWQFTNLRCADKSIWNAGLIARRVDPRASPRSPEVQGEEGGGGRARFHSKIEIPRPSFARTKAFYLPSSPSTLPRHRGHRIWPWIAPLLSPESVITDPLANPLPPRRAGGKPSRAEAESGRERRERCTGGYTVPVNPAACAPPERVPTRGSPRPPIKVRESEREGKPPVAGERGRRGATTAAAFQHPFLHPFLSLSLSLRPRMSKGVRALPPPPLALPLLRAARIYPSPKQRSRATTRREAPAVRERHDAAAGLASR